MNINVEIKLKINSDEGKTQTVRFNIECSDRSSIYYLSTVINRKATTLLNTRYDLHPEEIFRKEDISLVRSCREYNATRNVDGWGDVFTLELSTKNDNPWNEDESIPLDEDYEYHDDSNIY
jgi:hypothetical protein